MSVILITSILLTSTLSHNCGNIRYKDFLGQNFFVDTDRVCQGKLITFPVTLCTDRYRCVEKTTIFSNAVRSSRFNFNDNKCNFNVETSSATDDKRCSTPTSLIGDPYAPFFRPICLIHDMCLKIKGRTDTECDNEFGFNARQMCFMVFPDASSWPVSFVRYTACLATATAYEAAVKVPGFGSEAHNAIDIDYCQGNGVKSPSHRPTMRFSSYKLIKMLNGKKVGINNIEMGNVIQKNALNLGIVMGIVIFAVCFVFGCLLMKCIKCFCFNKMLLKNKHKLTKYTIIANCDAFDEYSTSASDVSVELE